MAATLWSPLSAAEPAPAPDACALYRIDHIRLHTVWVLFRQNLGPPGGIIPPFADALGAWMDEKPLEAQRLLEQAANWPETEDNQGAVRAARLMLGLMRGCDPEGRLKLQPRRRGIG